MGARREGWAVGIAIGLVAIACARRAAAQESLDEIAGGGNASTATTKTVEVNGYLSNRFSYTHVDPGASPAWSGDVPSLSELLEGNVQLKVHLGQSAFAYADISLFLQGGWLFYTRAPDGGRQDADDPTLPGNVDIHDRPSLRPYMVASELYLSWSPKSWLNVLIGRKRIVWGSGVAWNPTDLINPLKDPTDPNLQRAGAWVLRVELPFEKFTISALAAPSILYSQSGLPVSALKYPEYPSAEAKAGLFPNPRDDAYHYLVAARLYALLFDADVNLVYYFSNQYQDGFNNHHRIGASFSRYFFTDYELHVEALFQRGSPRQFPDHACAGGGFCNPNTALTASKLDKDAIYPRVLAGFRTMFKDEAVLALEYYYQGDGDSDLEFSDRVKLLAKLSAFIPTGIVPASLYQQLTPAGSGQGGSLPSRFGFDPLRRHYLIASYSKPHIHDDWSVMLVAMIGLRDLSGLISPSVTWNVREWLNLSLWGYVPIRWIPVGQAQVNGQSYSEFGLAPFDFRLMFEARAFY